jgi:hypothetical protein
MFERLAHAFPSALSTLREPGSEGGVQRASECAAGNLNVEIVHGATNARSVKGRRVRATTVPRAIAANEKRPQNRAF